MQIFARYITGGTVIFAFNIGLAWAADQFPAFHQTKLITNITHFIVTEIALCFAFLVHNSFTWPGSRNFITALLKFHLVSLVGLLSRFGIFFLLTHLGLNFMLATLSGILAAMLVNFLGYDRIVFNQTGDSVETSAYDSGGAGIETLETIEEAIQYNQWIVSKITPYLKQHNLELGAGTGTIAHFTLQEAPIQLCELSDSNLKTLKNRFKGNPNLQGIIKDVFSLQDAATYDCIYSSNVMEHVEDDLEMIGHCLGLLNPGGHFVAFVPAGKLLYSRMDQIFGHFRRYSWSDYFRIRKLTRSLGNKNNAFKILKYRFFNPLGAMGWFLKMRLLGNTNIDRSDAMLMDRLMPYLSKLDFIPWPYGQNILFVIKRI